ncbi:MAG: tRNA pseudouridine synthase A [Sulfolobales archaeon]
MDLTSEGFKFVMSLDSYGGVSRGWLVKREEATDERYGCLPRLRPLSQRLNYGVVVIDKPPGPTSHEVVSWIKEMLNVPKAGHGGTLEPSTIRWLGGDIRRLLEYSQ